MHRARCTLDSGLKELQRWRSLHEVPLRDEEAVGAGSGLPARWVTGRCAAEGLAADAGTLEQADLLADRQVVLGRDGIDRERETTQEPPDLTVEALPGESEPLRGRWVVEVLGVVPLRLPEDLDRLAERRGHARRSAVREGPSDRVQDTRGPCGGQRARGAGLSGSGTSASHHRTDGGPPGRAGNCQLLDAVRLGEVGPARWRRERGLEDPQVPHHQPVPHLRTPHRQRQRQASRDRNRVPAGYRTTRRR